MIQIKLGMRLDALKNIFLLRKLEKLNLPNVTPTLILKRLQIMMRRNTLVKCTHFWQILLSKCKLYN